MWFLSQLVSKEPKNQIVPNTQPKPTLLASMNKCRVFEVNVSPDGKKALPLKCSIKRRPDQHEHSYQGCGDDEASECLW